MNVDPNPEIYEMWLTHPSPISHTHQPASQPHNRFELRTLHKNTVQLHNAMQTGGILILLLSTSLQPTRSHLIPSIPFPTEVGWSSHPPSGSSRSPKQASKQGRQAGSSFSHFVSTLSTPRVRYQLHFPFSSTYVLFSPDSRHALLSIRHIHTQNLSLCAASRVASSFTLFQFETLFFDTGSW